MGDYTYFVVNSQKQFCSAYEQIMDTVMESVKNPREDGSIVNNYIYGNPQELLVQIQGEFVLLFAKIRRLYLTTKNNSKNIRKFDFCEYERIHKNIKYYCERLCLPEDIEVIIESYKEWTKLFVSYLDITGFEQTEEWYDDNKIDMSFHVDYIEHQTKLDMSFIEKHKM